MATSEVRGRSAHYASLRDSDLVLAMRRDEQQAFVEFIERLRMIAWNHARDLGVDPAERRTLTEEALHDCALALSRDDTQIPGNLAGYVVISVRRKFFEQLRKTRNDRSASEGAANELSNIWSGSADESAVKLPEPVVRLIDGISATLTEDEELLLIWKGHRITYGTIAEWLGESRSAIAQRVWRLTRRVSQAAEQIIAHFSAEDRKVIRRFLHEDEEDKRETL